jgi:nucleotidyltransferase substrate binding protein (TIGR01987 family)
VEQLKDRLEQAKRALNSLAEALAMPFSVIVRDASIQRFEYTFESIWKLLKAYLNLLEGVVCNSPKQCFREALKAGLLTAEDTWATCWHPSSHAPHHPSLDCGAPNLAHSRVIIRLNARAQRAPLLPCSSSAPLRHSRDQRRHR